MDALLRRYHLRLDWMLVINLGFFWMFTIWICILDLCHYGTGAMLDNFLGGRFGSIDAILVFSARQYLFGPPRPRLSFQAVVTVVHVIFSHINHHKQNMRRACDLWPLCRPDGVVKFCDTAYMHPRPTDRVTLRIETHGIISQSIHHPLETPPNAKSSSLTYT
ncbi:hypothetical protein BS50DRAFT_179513 [Corynespora cassiicola Philippines]|uniref:Uncharacterized protein n=1 Tax=Corynespora cassiicola Philippines TaxID=1448308 RepID=A0A2T2P616_CORCC|nr:hypothetical protein BS50DRAFT_179513 [Corynespora cassiicola Philippines]